MKYKRRSFWSLFRFSKTKEATSTPRLPNYIEDSEKIVRSIFSPKNVHKTKNIILSNAYRTPSGKDEVSVNRLDFTNETFCKKLSKKIEQPEYKKNYYGLGLHLANQIRKVECDVTYSPVFTPENDLNQFHSDILIGYIPEKGKQLPAEFQEKVDNLAKISKLFIDPDPNNEIWTGDVVMPE